MNILNSKLTIAILTGFVIIILAFNIRKYVFNRQSFQFQAVSRQTFKSNNGGLSFEHDTIDIGNLQEGTVKQFALRFKNVSKQNLRITGALAGCGCTSLVHNERDIKPNEMDSVMVSYNSYGKAGAILQPITLSLLNYPQPLIVYFVANIN